MQTESEVPRNYNYVFYNVGMISDIFFSELHGLENVGIPPEGFLPAFKIPDHAPLKRLVFKKMYDAYSFDNQLPTCFVFLGGRYAVKDNGYIEYIKKRDKRNKILFMMQDIMARKFLDPDMRNLDIVKPKVDLITTYDKNEAQKYGFTFMKEEFYESWVEVTEPIDFDTDLLFIGHRKERFDFLLEIAQYLSSQGVRCDFIIAGVDEADREQVEGVSYVEGYLPYAEYVAKIQRSRCILEVAQAGSVAHTLRTSEALVYRRKLLTNRKIELDDLPYSASQIRAMTSIDTIDVEFLRSANQYAEFPVVNWKQRDRLTFFEEHLRA